MLLCHAEFKGGGAAPSAASKVLVVHAIAPFANGDVGAMVGTIAPLVKGQLPTRNLATLPAPQAGRLNQGISRLLPTVSDSIRASSPSHSRTAWNSLPR